MQAISSAYSFRLCQRNQPFFEKMLETLPKDAANGRLWDGLQSKLAATSVLWMFLLFPGCFFSDFWYYLGDFGRHFGPSWEPRGSPNRAFWHQVINKSRKMASRRGSWKNLEKSLTVDVQMRGFEHVKLWIFDNFTWELQSQRVFRHLRKKYRT